MSLLFLWYKLYDPKIFDESKELLKIKKVSQIFIKRLDVQDKYKNQRILYF